MHQWQLLDKVVSTWLPLSLSSMTLALTTISFYYAAWREGGLRFTPTIWMHAPACGVLNGSGRVLLAWALGSRA
jgi:hypothetical protein